MDNATFEAASGVKKLNRVVDGDTFKNRYLMDKHQIQVNKTSRNSVLFMTNIGTTRGSVAYLIKVLLTIADELEARNNALNHAEKQLHIARIRSLTQETPPLPDFSRFHDSFRAVPGVPGGRRAGDTRGQSRSPNAGG